MLLCPLYLCYTAWFRLRSIDIWSPSGGDQSTGRSRPHEKTTVVLFVEKYKPLIGCNEDHICQNERRHGGSTYFTIFIQSHSSLWYCGAPRQLPQFFPDAYGFFLLESVWVVRIYVFDFSRIGGSLHEGTQADFVYWEEALLFALGKMLWPNLAALRFLFEGSIWRLAHRLLRKYEVK